MCFLERFDVTTDHPASSDGQPVLVDNLTGKAIGMTDQVEVNGELITGIEIARRARAELIIVDELIEIGRTKGFLGKGGEFDSNEHNLRARQIGEELNERGGLALMQEVWYRVTPKNQRELEWVWNGIGEWFA